MFVVFLSYLICFFFSFFRRMNEKSEDAKVKKRREGGGESYYVVTGEREGWALEVRKSWSAAQVFSVRKFI